MQGKETKMTLSFLDRLRARRPAPLAQPPVFEGLAQVRAYWEGLRGDGRLPHRSALDPRGLSGVLDRVFLAERIGRGLVQLRIAGSGLADFAGTDVRGLPLSCLFAPESRPQLAQSVERVFDTPAVAELDLGSDRAAGGGLVARLLLLPLAEDRGMKLSLGAFSFAADAPACCKLQLRSWREEQLHLPTVDVIEPKVEPIRRYGHLSLVHVSD
jgi:hypothetical protein